MDKKLYSWKQLRLGSNTINRGYLNLHSQHNFKPSIYMGQAQGEPQEGAREVRLTISISPGTHGDLE